MNLSQKDLEVELSDLIRQKNSVKREYDLLEDKIIDIKENLKQIQEKRSKQLLLFPEDVD